MKGWRMRSSSSPNIARPVSHRGAVCNPVSFRRTASVVRDNGLLGGRREQACSVADVLRSVNGSRWVKTSSGCPLIELVSCTGSEFAMLLRPRAALHGVERRPRRTLAQGLQKRNR
jgi:hypothetical protein